VPASAPFSELPRSVTDRLAVRLRTTAQKFKISSREHVTGQIVMRDGRVTDTEECLRSSQTLDCQQPLKCVTWRGRTANTKPQKEPTPLSVLDKDQPLQKTYDACSIRNYNLWRTSLRTENQRATIAPRHLSMRLMKVFSIK
jgi:hypothetical protein